MPATNRPSTHARDARVIQGIPKVLSDMPTLVLGGVTYTPETLAALFQSHVDAGNAVLSAHAQWLAAIEKERALTKVVNNALLGLKEIVRQKVNNAPDALAELGFTPRKVPQRDPLTHVIAAEKSRATREARHTMGPKQRLAVRGAISAASVAASVVAAIGGSAAPAREPRANASGAQLALPYESLTRLPPSLGSVVVSRL